MAAGLCGVTLYFLFENIALTYSAVSSVGVIVSEKKLSEPSPAPGSMN